MSNFLGAFIGAAIDRQDGDSGIKGAVLGALTQGAIKIAVPVILLGAAGLAIRHTLQKNASTAA